MLLWGARVSARYYFARVFLRLFAEIDSWVAVSHMGAGHSNFTVMKDADWPMKTGIRITYVSTVVGLCVSRQVDHTRDDPRV